MKNLKNTLAAASLAVVMGMGTVSANAGIMVSDKTSNSANPCAVQTTGILNQVADFVLSGFTGIILTDRAGIMVSDRNGIILTDKGCAAKDGIILTDRDGIMVSD